LLRERAVAHREDGPDTFFNAEQHALIARNGERYYRTMVRGGPASWNVRDTHVVETRERLTAFHGPSARAIVWEHHTGIPDFLLPFAERGAHPVMDDLREPRGHRAIGVVYHPELEQYGNYVPTILPGRYDAFMFFDGARAVAPLHMPARVDADLPETYPSGV
jgi:erythromycin esterase-like protein